MVSSSAYSNCLQKQQPDDSKERLPVLARRGLHLRPVSWRLSNPIPGRWPDKFSSPISVPQNFACLLQWWPGFSSLDPCPPPSPFLHWSRSRTKTTAGTSKHVVGKGPQDRRSAPFFLVARGPSTALGAASTQSIKAYSINRKMTLNMSEHTFWDQGTLCSFPQC